MTNLCRYIESFLLSPSARLESPEVEQWQRYLNCVFGYSCIWAFGSQYKPANILKIDLILRDLFGRLLIPIDDTVFDYYFDEKKCTFLPISELVPKFVFPTQKYEYWQLFVPTCDTVRYGLHLEKL